MFSIRVLDVWLFHPYPISNWELFCSKEDILQVSLIKNLQSNYILYIVSSFILGWTFLVKGICQTYKCMCWDLDNLYSKRTICLFLWGAIDSRENYLFKIIFVSSWKLCRTTIQKRLKNVFLTITFYPTGL